jgi:hypothetical protein
LGLREHQVRAFVDMVHVRLMVHKTASERATTSFRLRQRRGSVFAKASGLGSPLT